MNMDGLYSNTKTNTAVDCLLSQVVYYGQLARESKIRDNHDYWIQQLFTVTKLLETELKK